MANIKARFSQAPDSQRARVKLIGLGSAGCNMIQGSQLPTVAFSTSSSDLDRSHSDRKILMGQDRLIGLAQTSHSVLKHLPSVIGHDVVDVLNNTDLAFLMCGLGGVSGSLGLRLFSSIARSKGSLDIVLAATPFSVESVHRREFSAKILTEILGSSVLCIEFDNDKLSELAPNLPMSRAFTLMNGIMMRPVLDMCAVTSQTDLGVMRQVIGTSTYGRFGLGLARGDDRIEKVVAESLSSPWFDYDIAEATGAIAIYSSADTWENEISKIIAALEGRLVRANLVFGSYSDQTLGDRIRLSVVLCKAR